jgi:CDP-glucose 4,6-dehydratase
VAGKLSTGEVFSFFRNKRILVTGHTGFKGSWLCNLLVQMGAHVIGFSIGIPTQPSLFERIHLAKNINHILGDVRDIEKLSQVIQETEPEICFHLAAQPLVRLSYENPMQTYTTNLVGSLHLLECVRLSRSIKTVVMITSDKCYENREWNFGYRETDSLGGYDPYSSSKACCEIVCSTYERSFFDKLGIGSASVRAGNVIGGGDWSQDRLVVDIIKSLSLEKEIIIRSPKATRPWQHVLDPLWGYIILAFHLSKDPLRYTGAWNFGPIVSQEVTVEDVVTKMISYWGKGSYKVSSPNLPHEAVKLALDIHKAVSLLDWYPEWDTDQAIRNTVTWYKAYYEDPNREMQSLCNGQINDYLQDVSSQTLNNTE